MAVVAGRLLRPSFLMLGFNYCFGKVDLSGLSKGDLYSPTRFPFPIVTSLFLVSSSALILQGNSFPFCVYFCLFKKKNYRDFVSSYWKTIFFQGRQIAVARDVFICLLEDVCPAFLVFHLSSCLGKLGKNDEHKIDLVPRETRNYQ